MDFEPNITPPLMVFEEIDPAIFGSVEDLVSYIEPIDVRSGIYRSFDATGLELRLGTTKVESGKRFIFWGSPMLIDHTTVAVSDPPERSPSELASRLTQLLRVVAPDQDVANANLPELVRLAEATLGYC